MKRFGSICISILLILSLCSPAYAADGSHTELETLPGQQQSTLPDRDTASKRSAQWREALSSDFSGTFERIMYDYLCKLGALMTEDQWLSFWSMNANNIQIGSEDVINWIDDNTGDIVVPSSVGQQYYNALTLYIENEYGYKIYPANKYTPSQYASLMQYFSNGQQANIKNTLSGDYSFTFYMPSNNSSDGSLYYPRSGDSPYIVFNNKPAGYASGYYCFEFYSADLSSYMLNMATRQQIYSKRQFQIFSNFPWQLGDKSFPSSSPGLVLYIYFKSDYKVFKSQAALRSYLLEGQSIYLMSGLNNRVQDLSVSVSSLSADYKKYTDDAIDKLLKAIADKKTELNVDTLTEQQLQDVIDASIGSSLNDLNQTLTDLLNQSAIDNAQMIQILKLIYDKLDSWDKKLFNDVTTGINLQDLKDLLQVDEDLTDAPKTIMEQLNLSINSIPDKILNGLDAHLDAALDKFFENKLEPLLRELIVPSPERVDTSMAKVHTNLPFISVFSEFGTHLHDTLSQEIEFDGSFSFGSIEADPVPLSESVEDSDDTDIRSASVIASHVGPITFDFSWYKPYRNSVHNIIRGFLWLGFCLRMMFLVPKILGGDADFWKD